MLVKTHRMRRVLLHMVFGLLVWFLGLWFVRYPPMPPLYVTEEERFGVCLIAIVEWAIALCVVGYIASKYEKVCIPIVWLGIPLNIYMVYWILRLVGYEILASAI